MEFLIEKKVGKIDFLFLDHDKSLFLKDFIELENNKFLLQNSIILSNTNSQCNKEYIEYLRNNKFKFFFFFTFFFFLQFFFHFKSKKKKKAENLFPSKLFYSF